MNKLNFARLASRPLAAGLALLQLAARVSLGAAANASRASTSAPFKIGWANIYSIPTG